MEERKLLELFGGVLVCCTACRRKTLPEPLSQYLFCCTGRGTFVDAWRGQLRMCSQEACRFCGLVQMLGIGLSFIARSVLPLTRSALGPCRIRSGELSRAGAGSFKPGSATRAHVRMCASMCGPLYMRLYA